MPTGLVFAGLSAGTVTAVGAAGGLALTALYLLRPPRRRVVVPFVTLWLSSAGESRADRLARRLRRFASLALQLIIVGLVLLAAGDIHRRGEGAAARSVFVLVDRSASMQATDEPGSRLDRARHLAGQAIAGLGPDDRAMVATFGGELWPLTGLESDRRRLAAAIDGISASDEAGDVADALTSLAPLLGGHPHPTVVVISDFAGGRKGGDTWQSLAGDALGAQVAVTFVPVGRRSNNLGIVAFSGRRPSTDPSSAELVVAAQNFRDVPSAVTLAITAGPQRIPVARRRLSLPAGARAVATFSELAAIGDDRLEAVLENTGDDLAIDDRAYAVIPRAPPATVLVVGDANLYLDGAVLGLEMAGDLRVDRLPASALATSRNLWAADDVVVFDGVTPEPAPLAGSFLYLDPHGRGSPWPERAGAVADPIVTSVLRAHPLLQQVNLSDLNVAAARRLTLRPGDVAVAASAQQALIVARDGPSLRQVGVAFDIRRSDLPLRSAFPLFLANAMSWLSRRSPPAPLSFVTRGTARIPVSFRDRGALAGELVEVQFPDGRALRVPVVDHMVTLALTRVGLVTARDLKGGVLVRAAVNLASAAESDLSSHPPPPVRPQQHPATVLGEPASAAIRRPWWVALALAALALALLEWVTFHRRLTV